jgi:hypothetical protein
MWAVTHAAAGAAIGHCLHTSPGLITSGALLSHIVLDAIPHWDYANVDYIEVWAIFDLALATMLTQALGTHTPNVTAVSFGALMAVIPDLEVVLHHLGVITQTYFPSHRHGFPHGQSSPLVGALIQIALTMLLTCVFIFAS